MLSLRNCYKSYDNGKTFVLRDLSININEGDFISITGESGTGKSSLMNILGTIDMEFEGKYLLDKYNVSNLKDKEITKIRNEKIGFVFQQYFLIPYLNVIENVMIPARYKKNKIDKDKVMEFLEKLRIRDIAYQKINTLSGGEMQRVSIARAMINNPSILLCDEPTGNLDNTNSKIVMDILEELNENGTTIVLVTHNLDLAKRCKIHYELKEGKLNKINF